MRKVLTLAILGSVMAAPFGASAQTTPAFIGATACEAAAPLRTDALAYHRAVSARTNETVGARRTGRATDARGGARAEHRTAARAERGTARPAKPSAEAITDQAAVEMPESVDEAPALRRAVHFCVGTPGARRAWMT